MNRRHRTRTGSSNLLGFRPARDLSARREIAVELPEFLIALLEERVSEANDGTSTDERVTVSDLVEVQVAELLSVRQVAELDLRMPGFSAAVQEWLRAAEE
jgi:hypothetical protein